VHADQALSNASRALDVGQPAGSRRAFVNGARVLAVRKDDIAHGRGLVAILRYPL